MRSKKLMANTFTSLLREVCMVVSSFIIPRLIISYYGSEVNGLVNSITQFLQVITFLDLGVGAVVQSSLYKPLANNDRTQISAVITSASRFFNRIGLILAVYIVVLFGIYPIISKQNFGFVYIDTLIFAMGISVLSQYYIGVVDGLLLQADQRGYIQYIAQILAIIAVTILSVIIIRFGGSIQIVKLVTSIVYLLRAIGIRIYVNHRYKPNRKAKYTIEPIAQKWNGLAQHVASVVLDGTDTIVLTVFATLSDVSIYSVYHLVVYGVKNVFLVISNGIQSLLGELWAKQDKELSSIFHWIEWTIHNSVVFAFGCTGVLILPFITVYTKGVADANYYQPAFALLIVMAHAFHCLRLPYHMMIKASGHYKETQNNYWIAALINIIISIATVYSWGLIGVAIGTLTAMLYQTIWMAWYNAKYLIPANILSFFKQVLVDVIIAVLGYFSTKWVTLNSISYYSWIKMAVVVAFIWFVVVVVINTCFYFDRIKQILLLLRRKVRH